VNILAAPGSFARVEFHVGASDGTKEGVFEWCFSSQPANVLPFVKWKPNQPDNLQPGENCAIIAGSSGTTPDNVLLADISCSTTKKKYLCEVTIISRFSCLF